MEAEWPERDSREWLLGPRGASLEPGEDAVAHLPVEDSGAAVLGVPQTAPTVWVRDDLVDEMGVWDALARAVKAYDVGDHESPPWIPVPGVDGHLALLATP